MIGPKGKISRSRGRMRRAQSWKIAMPNLVNCSKCNELMVPHRVCKACGSYKKQTVINVE